MISVQIRRIKEHVKNEDDKKTLELSAQVTDPAAYTIVGVERSHP